MIYDIVIEVTLPDNPVAIVNDQLEFRIEIGNACEQNQI